MIHEIIFSPTGGTKAVADIVAQAFGEAVEVVDLCQRDSDACQVQIGEDTLAVIALPCYCGRVPAVAAERFRQIDGKGAAAVIVGVYGNRAYDDLLVEMQDLAEAAHFHVIAAIEAVAEHSIARQFATGRPDADDTAQLRVFVSQIATKLATGNFSTPTVPGHRPYKDGPCGGMVPQADDACVQCGKCAALCPVGAIAADALHTTDASRCISCMRCIAVCPTKARAIDVKALVGLAAHLHDVCSVRKDNALYL